MTLSLNRKNGDKNPGRHKRRGSSRIQPQILKCPFYNIGRVQSYFFTPYSQTQVKAHITMPLERNIEGNIDGNIEGNIEGNIDGNLVEANILLETL